jgi:hypothetical protein
LQLGNSLARQNSTLDYNNQGGVLICDTLTSATFGGLSAFKVWLNTSSAPVAFSVGNNNINDTY